MQWAFVRSDRKASDRPQTLTHNYHKTTLSVITYMHNENEEKAFLYHIVFSVLHGLRLRDGV